MPAVPGQRAGQLPQRAAVASQRALGRAAAAAAGMAAVLTVRHGGKRWHISHDRAGRTWWECPETGARHLNGPDEDEQEEMGDG